MEEPAAQPDIPVTIKLEYRSQILAKTYENMSIISTLIFVFSSVSFLDVATPKSSSVTYSSDKNALLAGFLSLTIGVSAVSLIMSYTHGYKIRMYLVDGNIAQVQECVQKSSKRFLRASRLTTSLSVVLYMSSLIIASMWSHNSESDLSVSGWLLGVGLLLALSVA